VRQSIPKPLGVDKCIPICYNYTTDATYTTTRNTIMQIVKYRNMTIATFDTIEEAELFTGTNPEKDYVIEEVGGDDPSDLDAHRQTVRSTEWKAAKARLTAFENKYGRSYNPD